MKEKERLKEAFLMMRGSDAPVELDKLDELVEFVHSQNETYMQIISAKKGSK